jgi:hypothetical protein
MFAWENVFQLLWLMLTTKFINNKSFPIYNYSVYIMYTLLRLKHVKELSICMTNECCSTLCDA